LVGAFYYIRVVKLMYFDEPAETSKVSARMDVSILLSANGLAILALGVLPQPLMQWCLLAMKGF
jgi:NADH-quinone oxidoreductase subunit N